MERSSQEGSRGVQPRERDHNEGVGKKIKLGLGLGHPWATTKVGKKWVVEED